MKREEILNKTGKAGVLVSLAAFLMFGLMHGALVGGTLGINTVKFLYTDALSMSETVMRIATVTGMALGAAVTCAMFVTCGLTVGRVVGYVWTDAGRVEDRDKTGALGIN